MNREFPQIFFIPSAYVTYPGYYCYGFYYFLSGVCVVTVQDMVGCGIGPVRRIPQCPFPVCFLARMFYTVGKTNIVSSCDEFYSREEWALSIRHPAGELPGSTVKPIFHWILGLRWPPNANKINNKNMANAKILRLEPNATYIPDSRWGFALGDAKNVRHLTQKIPTCWHR